MRDESYEAGYRAGHLQGWLDAMAKASAAQQASQMPYAPHQAMPHQDVPYEVTPMAAITAPASPLPPELPILVPPAATAWPASEISTVTFEVPASPEPPPTEWQPVVVETPAERQARIEKRDRQNINVTLYVASLLLVAAAALFIGTSLPPVMRFAGVCGVTGLFYAAGFVLHSRAPRLRPAAVAFAGTGLALVPVTGLALYNFALHNGPAAWLITSLIGTAAYVAASVRLESRVLVYLSLSFVASTAWSGVSVLGGALVWYFAALIGVAVLLTALALIRPGWLPAVYIKPLMTLHPFVVPAVAVAVNGVPLLLDKSEYALIMGMCGLYFALVSAVPGGRLPLVNFYAARLSLTVAAGVAIWDLTGRGSDGFLAAAALLAVQAVVVAFAAKRLDVLYPSRVRQQAVPKVEGPAVKPRSRWMIDALVTFGLQLVATWAYSFQFLGPEVLLPRGVAGQAGEVPLWVAVLVALVIAFILAERLRSTAEWAPVAALGLALAGGFVMGAWAVAGMLVLSSIFWLARALPAAGRRRGGLVLAARIGMTLAVPFAVVATQDGSDELLMAAFGLLVALVCQQALSAAFQRLSNRDLASEPVLAGFGAAGLLTLLAVAALDNTPGNSWTWTAIAVQLVPALAIGWILLPRPAIGQDWKASAGEAMPVAASLVAVYTAFNGAGQAAGNLSLMLAAGYLLGSAVRLPARLHRWVYWWLGRAAVTVLVMTAFHQLQDAAGPTVFANEILRPATVLIVVLAVQLIFPLAAVAGEQAPDGAVVDAGVVVFLQLAASGIVLGLGTAGWQGTFAAALTAVCAASAGYVFRLYGAAAWLPGVSLAILLVLSRSDLLAVELLLGIFAVYAAVMVVAAPAAAIKGWYFVAARILTAALALVLSYDITASPTVVSVTFAVVLAAQHCVRWVMRSRLAEIPFQQTAVWITLAGQAALPLTYALQEGAALGRLPDNDGGRWVVLLELVLLLVSAIAASRLFAARGALYFAVYALLTGVLALGPYAGFGSGEGQGPAAFLAAPVLDHTGTATVLMGVAGLASVVGALRKTRNQSVPGVDHWLWIVTAAAFALTSFSISPPAADWVPGAALLVLAAVGLTASHVEAQPWTYPPAVACLLAGATAFAAAVSSDAQGEWGDYLPWLAGTGLAAVGLYAVRLVRRTVLGEDPVRRWSLAGAGFAGLLAVTVAGIRPDATAWTAAVVLVAVAAVAWFEAPRSARRIVAEVGAVAVVAAVQRAAIFELDRQDGMRFPSGIPDRFWAAQWYVIAAAVLGSLRYFSGQRTPGRFLIGAAAGLLTLSGLGIVFGGTGGQQLWVLVMLALLLAGGLLLGDRLFVWWGAAGVAGCILWAMRGYTFALLALIAVGLIAFAVWRLNRGAKPVDPVADPYAGPPASEHAADQDPVRRH